MSKRSYFSQYNSPNIIIVPTFSFRDDSTTKRMRLETENHVEGNFEMDRKSQGSVVGAVNSENSELVKTVTNGSENISTRNKPLANVGPGKPTILLDRLKIRESRNEDSMVIKTKNMSAICKGINKEVNFADKIVKANVSELNTLKKYPVSNTNRYIECSDKNKVIEVITKKTRASVCDTINKEINKSNRTALKSTNNQQHSSSKKVNSNGKHDDTGIYKTPKIVSTNKPQNYDKYTDNKLKKNKCEQNYKYDSGQNSKKEPKCKGTRDKSHLELKSDNIYDDKKIIKYTNNNDCSNATHSIKNYRKHNTSKYKDETQIHKEVKYKYISKSKHKKASNNVMSTDYKKSKIQKESAKKQNYKNINLKKSCSHDQVKNKKDYSTNKSKDATNSILEKGPPNKFYENLTITVNTQTKKREKLEPPKTNKISNSHQAKKIKLIINVIINNEDKEDNADKEDNTKKVTQDTSCSKTEDNKSSPINSELSFLDDINIDEIVDSLKQPKREVEEMQLVPRCLSMKTEEPIIINDDSSETQYNIRNFDKLSDESTNAEIVEMAHSTLVKQRSTMPSIHNFTTLPAKKNTKKEVIEDKITIETIDITDDSIEALSDCSTVVLDELDSDVEKCDDIPKNTASTLVSDVMKCTNYKIKVGQNDDSMKSTINHVGRNTQETTIIKDPIEVQLNKMFEIYSSDIESDVEKNRNVNVDKPVDVNMLDAQSVVIVPPQQNKITDHGQHQHHETQYHTDNISLCSILNTNNTRNTFDEINPNMEIIESQKPTTTSLNFNTKALENQNSTTVNINSYTKVVAITENPRVVYVNPNINIIENQNCTTPDLKMNTKVIETQTPIITNMNINMKCIDCQNFTVDDIDPKNDVVEKQTTTTNIIQDMADLERQNGTISDKEPKKIVNVQKSTTIEISTNMKVVEAQKPIIITTDPNPKVLEIRKPSTENTNNINQNIKCVEKQGPILTDVHLETKGIENQKIIDEKILKPQNTVKSQIRKATEKKPLPLTQEEKKFIEALEDRMSSFFKKIYTVTSLIHKGKHSSIYQCINSGGYNYALKVLNNTRAYYSGLQKERMLTDIQKDIPKENLNFVYVVNGFAISGYWCLLMDYYPKTLLDALSENDKSFHIDTVQVLSKQLIIAVMVLRNNNIVHSDIKPSHIMINSKLDRIKLCGFDTAFYIQDTVMAPSIGTPNYRAPEVILGYSSGFSLDVWSSALVMYEMVTKIKLFPGYFNNDILYKQQCTLGGIPYDMLMMCMFKDNHFYGKTFMRKIGINRQTIKFIYKFNKSNRMNMSIFDAYDQDWSGIRTDQQRNEDEAKLLELTALLEKMLNIHPRHRLPIEFVYANPFIYDYY